MKNVLQRIAHKGATFTNAFTSSAICCPSRSSILSGQLAHNCATVNNSLTGGCYGDFWRTHVEPRTIAAVANSIGMETFFAGKYLNQVSWGFPINFCLTCSSSFSSMVHQSLRDGISSTDSSATQSTTTILSTRTGKSTTTRMSI